MGGHYGSIHVRTDDRERVKHAAEAVATAMNIRMLVGPSAGGWVGLYPENNGQDTAVSKTLAGHLADPLLHVLVHDDDIFAYWLYMDGDLVDSFWSAPGYFGEENRAAEQKMAGNPEAFRPILGDGTQLLVPLLDRQDAGPTFEYERLEKFAKVLDIANAVTAYEYLKEGERDGIRGWRSFEEVPVAAVAADQVKKRRKANATKSERAKLVAQGLLLLSDERKDGMPYGCAVASGFVVAWPEHLSGQVSFSRYESPWSGPLPFSPDVPAHITAVTTDASGRRVAMSAGSCTRVWDVGAAGSWNLVADLPESDLAVGAALSADGRLVAHLSRQQLYVCDVETSRVLHEFPGVSGRDTAFHPSGQWLAAASTRLHVVQLGQNSRSFELYVAGRSTMGAAIGAAIQAQLKQVDPEALKKRHRDAIEKAIEQMAKVLPPDRIAAMRDKAERELEQALARMAEVAAGRLGMMHSQPNEQPMCVGFSRDGKWMWCGTNAGLRVYEWSKVLRENGADMPPPTHSFEPRVPADDSTVGSSYVYAIAEERDAAGIVFGGNAGRIYRMELDTGRVVELAKLPGNRWAQGLVFSLDRQALGVASLTDPIRTPQLKAQRREWQVWDYARLRDSGTLVGT